MNDLSSLGRIAYRTGFFGEPARVFFADAGLFADLWVRPYLGGACGFALVQGEAVVGYVLGSDSPAAYRRALRRTLLARVLPTLVRGGYPQALSALPYLLRLLRFPPRRADEERFPAHLHVNLLPEARGQGGGEALLRAHLSCLQARGVPGVQLSTTRENEAALGLYAKLGFHEAEAFSSPLWRPWLGRDAAHVTLAKSL